MAVWKEESLALNWADCSAAYSVASMDMLLVASKGAMWVA